MNVENPSDAPSNRRRRTWPIVVVGTGIVGAATLTLTLLSPLGNSSAAAGELTVFDDCDALGRHMSGLVLDRILDSRRAYDQYYSRGGDDEATAGRVEEDRAVPPMAQMDGPQGVPLAGAAGDGAMTMPDAAAGAATDTSGASGQDAAAAAPAAESALQASSKSSTGSNPSDAVGNSASGTNNQEAGVDEADLAKTDGRLLVTARDGRLVVMDVSGRTPRARGSVALPGQRALELLLAGDRAIVVGTADSRARYLDDEAGTRSRGAADLTTLTVVDLANPDRPVIVSSEEITARYLSARMTGDTVRVVLSSTPDVLRGFSTPYNGRKGFDWRDDAVLDETRDRLERLAGEDWLPMRRDVDREARTVSESPLLACSDVRYPVTDSGTDLLTVLSINTGLGDALEQAAATALIGSGDLVYATADKLFVATTDGGWNDDWAGGWGDRGRRGGVTTRVHSFDITGADAEYLASGRVDGYLYGRWAMSERDGLLRMVTTTTAPWNRGGGGTETGVVVLDTAGERMREIGRVDGMGFTETVRAVRWFDDVAAIVTFRQTDPLYLVDLSRPESPRVRGELKIPGYSAYLHPIGDHRLLGIGQDANQWGGTLGLQMSNFDILDLADPQRTDALTFGRGTTSPVENDPRGFVYLPSRSLAVLPVFSSIAGGTLGFACPANAKCPEPSTDTSAYSGDRRPDNGLVAVRVTDDGKLRQVASWSDSDGRRVVKLIPLTDGRIVALDYRGVRIFDAESLKLFGSALYR